MRAIMVNEFGGPEVLEPVELPDPVPGQGQVLVDVDAVDTLFLETMVRSGNGGAEFPVRPPYTPGLGVAGRVDAVGEGVEESWLGRAVVARTPGGGYAEKALAAAESLVPVPDGLTTEHAAALIHDGTTAMGVLAAAEVTSSDTVLVVAAAGGMGTLLVQLARARGAYVVGAARGDRKLAAVTELGANAVVDYSLPGWTERVHEATGGIPPTIVFDGAGGELGRAAFDLMADGGHLSAHGTPSGSFTAVTSEEAAQRGITVRGIRHVQFAPEESSRLMSSAFEAAAEGRVAPVIGRRFPLVDAAGAHAAIEGRTISGKALLIP